MRRPATAVSALALTLGLASLVAGGPVWGAFGSTTPSAGNTITAATDFRAPTSSATVIAKSAGGTTGYVKQGGAYFVYAKVTDTGNPASGISAVTANVSSITTGQTAAALSAGSYTVSGSSYNYRSASLTANASLTAGSYSFTLTMTDAAGNSGTQSGLSVTVDNTVPTASDIQTANGGSIAGRPEQNDTITYTFSEPPEPNSILSGWTGAATNVVVRVNNATNDNVRIYNSANTAQLPLGSVDLGRTDYVSANRTFGATGTASSMVLSGSTITITLGTQSGAGTTAAATGTMIWTPSATATDRAGNAMSTATATETGAADKEF
ncbi:MAG: Ig-like domain-containing protein [Solirubrobacterales bacterium]